MNIKLADNTELEPIMVMGEPRYVQGANRDTLGFVFPASAGLEALDAAFAPESCQTITIQDDEGSEHIHIGYTIRAELAKAAVEIKPATAETEAVYEDRITVVMAQRTYAENQLDQLLVAVAAIQAGSNT